MINCRSYGGLSTAVVGPGLGIHMNPALPPLARFPKRFEAHTIGWKDELYA
jgi:hypothetical protein